MLEKAEVEYIQFVSDGRKLLGRKFLPRGKKAKYPAVLFIHGWLTKVLKDLEYAKEVAKLGYVCLAFNLSGHGKSGGDINLLSRADFLNDALSAYDFLANQPNVDKNEIHVVGSSFGSYLAAILTSKRKVKSLVLRVPQNYPNEGFDQPKVNLQGKKLKGWREEKLSSKATYVLDELSKFDGRVLLVESELDKYVSKQTYQNFRNAVKPNKLKYVFGKGMSHSIRDKKNNEFYVNLLEGWFNKNI